MACGADLAAALAPACKAGPVRLAAGFALGWGAAFPLALGAATDFFGGTKSSGIHFSSHISRVQFPIKHMPQAPNTTCTLCPYYFHIIILLFLLFLLAA